MLLLLLHGLLLGSGVICIRWAQRAQRFRLGWAWLLLGGLLVSSIALSLSWPAWGRMWAVWSATFIGFKGFVLLGTAPETICRLRGWRWWAFTLAWLGMQPEPWLESDQPRGTLQSRGLWRSGLGLVGIGLGLVVVCGLQPLALPPLVWAAGVWVGVVIATFFGLTRLLVAWWRSRGIGVDVLFDRPVYARHLADWWGRRWNRPVHHVLQMVIWQPLAAWPLSLRLGAVFGASGLLHELLLSYPANGGWGLPSVYFGCKLLACVLSVRAGCGVGCVAGDGRPGH